MLFSLEYNRILLQSSKDGNENQYKYEHITPVFFKLQWLPIKSRIQIKVLPLVNKALNRLAPKFIKELLGPYKPRRHLRLEAKGLLGEPWTKSNFGMALSPV